ncbi:MAG: hypothetical protein WDN04_17725 [Rhodospirillales bacterium]
MDMVLAPVTFWLVKGAAKDLRETGLRSGAAALRLQLVKAVFCLVRRAAQ